MSHELPVAIATSTLTLSTLVIPVQGYVIDPLKVSEHGPSVNIKVDTVLCFNSVASHSVGLQLNCSLEEAKIKPLKKNSFSFSV